MYLCKVLVVYCTCNLRVSLPPSQANADPLHRLARWLDASLRTNSMELQVAVLVAVALLVAVAALVAVVVQVVVVGSSAGCSSGRYCITCMNKVTMLW